MQLNRFTSLFLLALGLIVPTIWADDYTIDEFNGMEEAEETDYIRGGFKQVQPNEVKAGAFFIRVKYEDPFEDISDYQIFRGQPTPRVNQLRRFTLPNASQATLVRAKVYLNSGSAPEDDLERVYFDGNGLLVDENTDELYINQSGRMVRLKMVDSRPMQLQVASNPTGATLFIDGDAKGETPVTTTIAGEAAVLLSVAKEGYYNSYKTITPKPGTNSSESVTLSKRETLDNPVPLFETRHQNLKSKGDVNQLNLLKGEIERTKTEWPSKVEKNKATVSSGAPLAQKQSGETAEAFEIRKARSKKDLDEMLASISRKGSETVSELDALLTSVTASITEVQRAASTPPQPEPEPEDDWGYDEEETVAESSRSISEEEEEEEYAFSAVTDAFGYGDDIKKYTGYALVVVAIGSAVMCGVEWMYVSEAEDALDKTEALLDDELIQIYNCRAGISDACSATGFEPNPDGTPNPDYKGTAMAELLIEKKALNKSNLNDHQTKRLVWGIAAGVGAVSATILLAVPF